MDALTVRRGNYLLAASIGLALAVVNTNSARAEATANQRFANPAWSALGETPASAVAHREAVNSDGVNALLLSGAVAFNPDPEPSDPGPPPPPPPPPPPASPASAPAAPASAPDYSARAAGNVRAVGVAGTVARSDSFSGAGEFTDRTHRFRVRRRRRLEPSQAQERRLMKRLPSAKP